MSPSSNVHGGQHDSKYVTIELLLHAAFVADEIWCFMLEPARIIINNVLLYQGTGTWYLAVSYSHLERNELDGTRAAYC